MNKQQITAITLEVTGVLGLIATILTAIPSSKAPSWVPIVTGIITVVIPYLKQQWGNTPQNVPGSTAADIAAGAAAPPTVPIAPPVPPAPVVVHPIPTPPTAP